MSDSSSRDSGSPKTPLPGFGRGSLPGTENDLFRHRLSPMPPPPLSGPRFPESPREERRGSSPGSVPRFQLPQGVFPRPPSSPNLRAAFQPPDSGRIKQTGEILQNIMLKQQRLPSAKLTSSPLAPGLAPAPAPPPAPAPAPARARLLPSQRSTGEVIPLKKPLPHEGPRPIKPKRPPSVNLEPYLRSPQTSAAHPGLKKINDEECFFRDHVEVNHQGVSEKKTQKEMKRQQEKEKKAQRERQKKENELKKNFQLHGEVDVLHTAKVRHDWYGGKLDLSVRQGESVEILRVKNNPGGKWLARTLTGNYGYISNTCVDIDYEEVKRKVLQSRGIDTLALPPPPPDPPQADDIYYDVDSSSHADSGTPQEDDDYDDVQPISEDFPPPPPDISVDPKLEKELKKKFRFEGPLRILHTMMVNPNGVIKKPGGKDLAVAQGEVLDVIQFTDNKKALCRNQFGKFGWVSRSLLLQMEGDIYDDVDRFDDVYDNDIH
ncbi:uncharacterized protein ACN63O_024300 [Diretmus argenteus]